MKKITLLLALSICYFSLIAQSVALNYTVTVSGSNQLFPVASNSSFSVSFQCSPSKKIIKKEYCFSTNDNLFYEHNDKTNYSMLNFDYIKFRITTEDTATSSEADAKNKTNPKNKDTETDANTKTEVSVISFVTEQNYPGDTLRTANFFVGSFVKSIAGNNIPENELLDLFVKLNYGKNKRTFSFIGAEAGVGALNKNSTANNGVFRINEATANLNYAFYDNIFKPTNGSETRLTRTAFLGAGLKVFNTQPYLGAHIGITEINGPLFGSYFMAGYYVAPYKLDSTGVNPYRNNFYVEATFNAFGEHVPSFLKSIRLKFAMMLPMGNKDENPTNASVLSRLAVEVPLGHAYRF